MLDFNDELSNVLTELGLISSKISTIESFVFETESELQKALFIDSNE